MINRERNIELLQHLSGFYGFELKQIQSYHYRLFLPDRTLDYFPKTIKATIFRSQKWFTIEDLEKYIFDIYNNKTTHNDNRAYTGS